MDERRCVEVLRAHNEWRRYDGFTGEPGAPAMVNPTELGQALDHAIATIERERWRPIAEAPQSGEVMVLTDGGSVRIDDCRSIHYLIEAAKRDGDTGWYVAWRPLPDPQPDGQGG